MVLIHTEEVKSVIVFDADEYQGEDGGEVMAPDRCCLELSFANGSVLSVWFDNATALRDHLLTALGDYESRGLQYAIGSKTRGEK